MKRKAAGPAISVYRKVAAGVSDAWIRSVAEAAFKAAGAAGPAELGVALVGDAEIRRLNRKYRGKDKTTDVLSFGYGNGMLGDIIISVPQIRRQAKENGAGFRRELAMMLAHGCLHILGHDHAGKLEAARMFGLQDSILKRLGLW